MYLVTATHDRTPREFGPFPTRQSAYDWITRHCTEIANARVTPYTPYQEPVLHYATLPATEQRAIARDIAAEVARLEAEDDGSPPPF